MNGEGQAYPHLQQSSGLRDHHKRLQRGPRWSPGRKRVMVHFELDKRVCCIVIWYYCEIFNFTFWTSTMHSILLLWQQELPVNAICCTGKYQHKLSPVLTNSDVSAAMCFKQAVDMLPDQWQPLHHFTHLSHQPCTIISHIHLFVHSRFNNNRQAAAIQ